MVEFKNPAVAEKYTPLRNKDGKVHIPAGKKTAPDKPGVGYAGLLSNITLAAADKAFVSGSNLLALKESFVETNLSDSGPTADEEEQDN